MFKKSEELALPSLKIVEMIDNNGCTDSTISHYSTITQLSNHKQSLLRSYFPKPPMQYLVIWLANTSIPDPRNLSYGKIFGRYLLNIYCTSSIKKSYRV